MNDQSDRNLNSESNAPEQSGRRPLRGWIFLVIYVIVSGIPILNLFITSSIFTHNLPPEIAAKIASRHQFNQVMIVPFLIICLPLLVTSLHYLMRPAALWSWIDGRTVRRVVLANILFFIGMAILVNFWVQLHTTTPQTNSGLPIIAAALLVVALWFYIGEPSD